MSEQLPYIARLVEEWRTTARPMILADEVRFEDPDHKEIIAFVFLCTDSRTVAQFGDESSRLRNQLPPELQTQLIKGVQLYGNNPRPQLADFCAYVESAVQRCSAVVRVSTTSNTITRYKTVSRGGIRRETVDGELLPPLVGRELVPFMNMLKVTATAMQVGPVQIDVLLDRSFKLGLDPGQIGMDEERIAVIGPGTLNEGVDGEASRFSCPSLFQLICPPKKSAFRDLLLLPDAVAYRMRARLPEMRELLSRVDFHVDAWPESVRTALNEQLANA